MNSRNSGRPDRGFSLTELVIVISVLSILTGFALPAFERLMARSDTTAGINRIIGAVNYTRYTAITYRSMATLCPANLADAGCNGDWAGRLIVFLDHNANAKPDDRDEIISVIQAAPGSGSLTWRAFQNKQYLQFTQLGYTNFQNGNFTFCPQPGDIAYARQIIINVQGRARMNHRKDDEGYYLDTRNRRLRC
ncbi:MAG: GspH/FimT family pseudopilin [Pseudomonadales bacterium]|nr:GspH/FimT family pseudopilin [Pseudomonadales bacterium]